MPVYATHPPADRASVLRRSDELFSAYRFNTHRRAARLFAGLMAMQSLLFLALALWAWPLFRAGAESSLQLPVWAAVWVGGALSTLLALLGMVLAVASLGGAADLRLRAERDAALEHEVRAREDAENETRRAIEQVVLLVEQREVAERQTAVATRAKSEFLARMSHDLRTPLNAIILYSELLQEEAKSSNTGISIRDLQRIQASGKHLIDVINGILDLSKLEAGKMRLELGRFDVKGMIDDLTDSVAPLAQKNRNALTVRCHSAVGTMHGDLAKTRQILLNLLSNAAKFTTEGAIAIDVQRVAHRSGDQVEFAVTDTGVGMTEHQSRVVLQPFIDAAVTTHNYGGTGLGLAIVTKFCDLLGGTISVDSRLGHGSRVLVRLPADLTAASRTVQPGAAA